MMMGDVSVFKSEIFSNKFSNNACPKDFLPTYNESTNAGNTIIYYILYANERFNYGMCSQDLIAYRAIYGMTCCENTDDVYLPGYFVPNQEYRKTIERTVSSFSC